MNMSVEYVSPTNSNSPKVTEKITRKYSFPPSSWSPDGYSS